MDSQRPRPHNSDSDSDWDTTEDFNSPRQESQAQTWKQNLPTPVSQSQDTARPSSRGAGSRPQDDRNAHQDGGQDGMSQGRLGGNLAPSPRPRGFKLPSMDGPSEGNWDGREDRSSRQTSRGRKSRNDCEVLKTKAGKTSGHSLNPKKRKNYNLDGSCANLIPDGGDWGDSENEERTLRELRETMQREKSKEREKERQQVEMKARLAQLASPRGAQQEPQSFQDVYAVPSKVQRYEKQPTPSPTPQVPSRDEILTPGLVYLNYPQDTTQNALLHQGELVYHDTDNNKCRYFFQKNNPSYYEVEEPEQDAVTPKLADKVEKYLHRGWREVFGLLRIVTGFFVVFAVEFTHFATRYVAQPLFLGVVMVIGDRLVKPLLAALYNFLLQPALLLVYNLLLTGQQALIPVLGVTRELTLQAATIVGALRLVAVNSPSTHHTTPHNTPRPLPLTNHSMQMV